MNRQDKQSHSFKTQKRFRLSFINENTFNEVWTIKMSQTKVILSVIAIILAIGCIVSTIIVSTPIKTLLPGYLKISQRQENILNSMRLDSLLNQVDINNAYIKNINDILTDNVDTTLNISVNDSVAKIIPIDSIIDASNAERQFVQQFEEQEQFNLSVLAPIAAEGMIFYTPIPNATIKDPVPTSPYTLYITAPALSPVSSIYNGTIIDKYYTPSAGNVVIIQHPNDFISKYSGISETFISKGYKVNTGQRIGIIQSNNKSGNYPTTFELWHKGTPLSPLDYIAF